MNIHRLIFTEDSAQSLRIKRLLSANTAYAFVALLTAYSLWFDLLPNFPIHSLWIVPLIPNVVFYTLIRSGLNLRFKDPSLTVPQTAYAILGFIYLVSFASDARGAFLMLALSTPIGIALRVRPQKLFWICVMAIVLLGFVILLQNVVMKQERNAAVDLLELLALAGGIAWLTADATYMARKRRETKESTQKLELALRENLTLIKNLTQQKEIAEAANLANLAKSRLVAAANHDLRQPLHALSLFVAQLPNCQDNSQRACVTKKIEDAITNINELFENLLDISKLDAGIVTPNISSFAIEPLFKRLENTFTTIAENKGLSIRFHPTSLGVRSEFILLERILLNLISNALSYTDKGKILIGCRRRGGEIHIQVWDTGCGIPVGQQRHIFKEFFRITPSHAGTATVTNSGLGLGLAIVERLCVLLDHKILVHSTPGKGSCFTLIAPLVAKPVQSSTVPDSEAPSNYKNKWILIIDDELIVRDAMRSLLQDWGCKVLVASSSDEAMQLLIAQQTKPDLIIADYTLMDETNGVAAITQIRRYFNFPINAFLISGNTDADTLRDIQNQNFIVLNKPLKPMVLRALLNKYLA